MLELIIILYDLQEYYFLLGEWLTVKNYWKLLSVVNTIFETKWRKSGTNILPSYVRAWFFLAV